MLELPLPKRLDPFDAGIAAFRRGEGWDRMPRYESQFDREKWQRGFSTESRRYIEHIRQRRTRSMTTP